MTNISKHKTKTPLYEETYGRLLTLIATLDKKKADSFVRSLLTESEQIMITKRFAAYLLFTQNYTSYDVAHNIGISISTAQRLHCEYDKGDFGVFFGKLPKKQQNGLLDLLSDIIMAQVSSKARARIYKRMFKS